MWAEAAGNYFATAHFHSTLENLVTLDFSYLPLLPRLCALLVHAFHISPAYVPVAYQSIAWVCISLCVAFFALPTFRLLVPSDLARVFVCLALALGPDYEVKTFINFSYYLAIVFYVVLAWCAVDNQVSRRRALVFGCLLTLAGLSKPHFLSFAPVLGCLLLWSIYKRRLWASVLFAMPLTGCVTQLCIAVMHRADIGQGGSVPLMRLLGLWLQWAPLSAASQIAGAMYHRPAVLRILFGSLWVLALAYFGWTKRHAWFRPTLLPLAIGITTMAFGALLSITPYPQQYEVHGGAYPVGLLTSRHWFVPTVVLLLSIAIALGRMLPRRWTPLMIAAWLPFAWPFGWHHRAHDADWPMTHASAWQGFASHVLSPKDGSSPRGCIPINPYPWYYGIDCQLLLPLKDLHANNFSQVASSYMAPPDATSWSVDSVGVRLSPPHTNDRVFVAYNAENQEIGRAIELQSAPSHLTHFLFTTPVERPRRIALLAPPSQDLQIVIDQAEGVPLWTWFGKMLPSPEEASSQAAR